MPKLITQELKLKDILSGNDLKKFCDEHGFDDDITVIRKGIVPSDLEFKEGERAVIAHITTDTIDRDGEIVDPAGVVLEDYEKNPVVLFGHDHRGLPIGKNMWIKRDERGLLAKTVYANHQLANDIYEYRKQGFPMAQSIGFIPISTIRYDEGSEERKRGLYRKFTKWMLLEYSDVAVPANPDAVAVAISKGLISSDYDNQPPSDELGEKKEGSVENSEETPDFNEKTDIDETSVSQTLPDEKESIEKPGWEETETSFRKRVKEPSLFQEGSFKTVPIKRDKPKVNSVMGKLKNGDTMKVQSLIFPKSEGWMIEQAKSWLGNHTDLLKCFDEGTIIDILEMIGKINESFDDNILKESEYLEIEDDEKEEVYELSDEPDNENKEFAEEDIDIDIDSIVKEKTAEALSNFKNDISKLVREEVLRQKGKV